MKWLNFQAALFTIGAAVVLIMDGHIILGLVIFLIAINGIVSSAREYFAELRSTKAEAEG